MYGVLPIHGTLTKTGYKNGTLNFEISGNNAMKGDLSICVDEEHMNEWHDAQRKLHKYSVIYGYQIHLKDEFGLEVCSSGKIIDGPGVGGVGSKDSNADVHGVWHLQDYDSEITIGLVIQPFKPEEFASFRMVLDIS